MEIGNEDRFSARHKMFKKSTKMESRPQQWFQIKQSSGKTQKEMGRRHQFLKLEETEETKGNDLKNNETWIRLPKDQIRWKEMENNTSRYCRRHETSGADKQSLGKSFRRVRGLPLRSDAHKEYGHDELKPDVQEESATLFSEIFQASVLQDPQ